MVEITIEVVYALPDEQRIVTLAFEPGMTAWRAVEVSRLAEMYPEILKLRDMLGIFGTRVEPERMLRPGDRVEICRPLVADARAMRHMLLANGKVMGETSDGS
jgi:putative ubiquitin-RnfH superfamily antitoxin RatB of RatAB toxin-antitoxin module